jgi:hypothetical protein
MRNLDEDISFSNDEGSFFDPDNPTSKRNGDATIQTQADPLDTEAASEAELSELLEGFKNRANRENDRMLEATDSEFWFCVCFQTREQKEEFLTKSNLMDVGDKYLDGMLVAEELKIKLTSRVPDMPKHRAFDKEYIRMSAELE